MISWNIYKRIFNISHYKFEGGRGERKNIHNKLFSDPDF